MARTIHVLLVAFPLQGHINLALQLAKRLITMGIEVTFATSVYAYRHMSKASGTLKRLKFATFSDGYDEGIKLGVTDMITYMTDAENRGMKALRYSIHGIADQGFPITSVVYTIFFPWAADLAAEFHIPSALLWIQPATVLDIYYYYFNGFEGEITKNGGDPNWSIQLPGLPLLSSRDLPSLMLPTGSDAHGSALQSFRTHLDKLDAQENPKILVNTFDALEPEALKSVEKFKSIGVGPLIPSAFLDGDDPTDTSYGADLLEKSKDYMEWLNSKPETSVVYVSFGSMLNLPNGQMEKIATGLLETGRPFLWVIIADKNGEEQEEEKLSCMEELEQEGIIVPWCSQLEVLTHPSLGCFVTHCGWNSTLESLVCGVPVVAFPQWTDQGTNAKLIQDVSRTGIRVATNEDGTVESDEIKRCIEMVMDGGEKGQTMRENAKKWKDFARESLQEGGSSYENLKSFVEEL